MSEQKIDPRLTSIWNQGAVTSRVLIGFHSEEDQEDFQSEHFTPQKEMSTQPVSGGLLRLEGLEDLAEDDRIEYVEPDARISIPDDPSEPQ